jgi:hypothetical protein
VMRQALWSVAGVEEVLLVTAQAPAAGAQVIVARDLGRGVHGLFQRRGSRYRARFGRLPVADTPARLPRVGRCGASVAGW